MNLAPLLAAVLEFLLKLAAPIAAFFWAKNQDAKAEAQKDAKQFRHDAQVWADRPSDDDAFAERLRVYESNKSGP